MKRVLKWDFVKELLKETGDDGKMSMELGEGRGR